MAQLINNIRCFFKQKFIRSIGLLAGGTAFAQLLALLALPALTRLYTPEDFTVLASYISILALLTVVACLRFEIAIPIPKDKETAVNLLVISIVSVFAITIITCVSLFFLAEKIN